MLAWFQRKYPYRGFTNWVAVCSVAFIVSELLWVSSRYVRRYDALEIPMTTYFFPLAPLFDPHDALLHNRSIFFYALAYWVALFVISLLLSRRRMNPIIPAIIILSLSAIASIVYSMFFVYRGPLS